VSGPRVRQAVIEAMIAHARAEAPLECCGLLLGRDDLIDESVRATNIRASPVAYCVDPRDHFAAIRRARATARRIIGAYHSHPSSLPIPSPTDVAEAFDSDLLYVIVSLERDEPDIRAYRIESGNFGELALVPVP
jgi:[CysO sulfur-carrier protein]-S-L-cysteine hydrolase